MDSTTVTVNQLPVDPTYKEHDKLMCKFWDDNDIMTKINALHNESEQVIFMEGPPFISGSGKKEEDKKESSGLHAGHCLVSEIKSCIFKYQHMIGHKCYPYTGTDNHGLPIENFVSKLLNLQTPSDIRNYGIPQFNQVCKETIMKYETLWDPVYKSIGRMVDLDHRYKTMDTNFMESVFWVFKTLWDKNLIYRGWKVLPYSYKTGTVLSNFEAGQNYKDITDVTAYCYFPLVSDPNTGFVAWTTTPWTLPCNVALCLNPDGKYVKVTDDKNRSYIVHENYVDNLRVKITSQVFMGLGKDLCGIEYHPPFNYYPDRTYKTITDQFVETTGGIGSGVVHLSPAYGELDYEVCMKNNIVTLDDVIKLCPINDNGEFIDPITDYKGKIVFDANPMIIEYLIKQNLLVRREKHKHSYPHSDRTGEPLIYRAMSSYFVKVTAIKDQLLEMNKKVNWIPSHVGAGRFQNWLENVKDWSISRSRFFGTPIPVWTSDDGLESVCVGSIDELVKLAKLDYRPTDLHPEFINQITITSESGKILKPVGLTLDCWFESGSVPYAQIHYPFENIHAFDNKEYLSDFVCEGIDQTRGWYYVLSVLSTALFNKPAFKNVICTGLVLDKEGKKMSKRHGNFKDPLDIIEMFGSDSVRMYLIGSSAVQADNLCFDEENIKIVKQKLIQWQNGIRFFIEHFLAFTKLGNKYNNEYNKTTNVFDQWILMRTNELIEKIRKNMESFNVSQCVPLIYDFIEDFTNWYLKLNRPRIKGLEGKSEWNMSLSVTAHVIMTVIKCMTPFTPFLSEYVYQHINALDNIPRLSVHLCEYPHVESYEFDAKLLENMNLFKNILTNVRALRSKKANTASIRKPIKKLYIAHDDQNFLDFIGTFEDILCTEVNCLELEISKASKYISFKVKPNMKGIAKKYKQHMKNIKVIMDQITQEQMIAFYKKTTSNIEVVMGDETLTFTNEEIDIISEVSATFGDGVLSMINDSLIIAIDTNSDDKLLDQYIIRQFCMAVQNLRKESDIHPWDIIHVEFAPDNKYIEKLITLNRIDCVKKLKCSLGVHDETETHIGKFIAMKKYDMYDLDDKPYESIMIKLIKLN